MDIGAHIGAGTPSLPVFYPRHYPDLTLWCDARGGKRIDKNVGSNLLPYSGDRPNWLSFGGSDFTDDQPDPLGGNNAVLVTENTADSSHYVRFAVATVEAATEYRQPIYVKSNGRKPVIHFFSALGWSSSSVAIFDLTDDGALVDGASAVNATIERMAAPYDDWYRIYADATSNGTSVTCRVGMADDGNNESYVGDGVSGITVFGPQLGLAAEVVEYQETGAQAETIHHVSQFTDQSGNANHLVQATDVNRPAYDAAAFGGRGGIYSDGDDRMMAVTGGIGESVDDPFTLFIVLDADEDATDPTTGSSVNCFLTSNEGASANNNSILIRQTRTDLKSIDVVGYTQGSSGNDVSNPLIFTVWFDGATFTVWQNGIQISSGSANNASVVTDKFQIFRDASDQRSGVGGGVDR